MYPRVKVRVQEEKDDQFEFGERSLQSLKVPGFLSSSGFSSPVNGVDDSPTSPVRVPQLDSSYPGAMNNRKQKLEENSANIKASPVFRPRAVLSSPDNDQIFGSKNKTRGDSFPSSKKNTSFPSIKCKVVLGPVTTDGPLNTRTDLKEVTARRNILQSKQRTVTADPSLKVNLLRGKPKPIQVGAVSKSPMAKRCSKTWARELSSSATGHRFPDCLSVPFEGV